MADTPSCMRPKRSAHMRLMFFALGVVLVVISPIIGVLPGPGGLILFPLGLMLCLKNSHWAKRRYVRFKIRHPKYGHWTDKVMRRASAKRRHAIDQMDSQMESKQMESLHHDN